MKGFGRKWTALCLAAVLTLALLPVPARAEVKTGDCGAEGGNVTYSLDTDTGILTISGTGDITDYLETASGWRAPWESNRSDITSAIISQGVTRIGDETFYECNNLTSVTIPDSVISIGENAFDSCTSLTSVTIPDSVTNIGTRVFIRCSSLTSVTIPNGLTSIGEFAFDTCTSLTTVTIPESVTTLGRYAFSDAGLTSIAFPKGVASIKPYAFARCTSLEAVAFQGGYNSDFDPSMFNDASNLSTIYYPWGDETWTEDNRNGLITGTGSTDVSWVPFGKTDLTVSKIPAEAPLEITVTSSKIPFQPEEAVKPENYTFDSTYTVTGAALSADNMTVTLSLQEAESGIAAQAAGSGLEINHAVLEAVELDPDTMTIIGSTSVYVDAEDPAVPDVPVDPVDPVDPENPVDPVDPDIPPADPEKPPASSTTTPNKGGSSSGTAYRPPVTTTAPEAVELPFPEVVRPSAAPASPIQKVVKDENAIEWGVRIDPPQYALDLYDALSGGSGRPSTFTDFLVQDASFQVSPVSAGESGGYGYEVIEAEAITLAMLDAYSDGENEGLTSMIFTDDAFFDVGVSKQDRAVNYGELSLGDLVRTDNFNGIFVTKEAKGDDYDQRKVETSSYIATVFQAFDKDHPEVFWLNGKCKVRILSVRDSGGSVWAYYFLALADKEGFTMKSPAWTAAGAVADGIQRRDAAVERILGGVTGGTAAEKLKDLNRILTETNEYNTTEDLTSISNEPHECLSALEGRTGTNGPVCDGYSRALKVLCDRLDIPCVLETGYAKPTTDSAGTFHMWNSVQVNENWYGVDVTWNDPMVKGVSGAKSGHENEQYLLVGSSTEIRGMTFQASHPAVNQAAESGVSFINGPVLSMVSFSALTAQSGLTALPFTDIPADAWYYGAVSYVHERGLMNGVSMSAFQPQGTITRQQMWMILARLSGASPADMAAARQWAMENGVSDGTTPGGAVSRQQMAAFLYRASGGTGGSAGQLAAFTDKAQVSGYAQEALGWAVEQGILTGTSAGTLEPGSAATRAQFAVVLQRFCGTSGQA